MFNIFEIKSLGNKDFPPSLGLERGEFFCNYIYETEVIDIIDST